MMTEKTKKMFHVILIATFILSITGCENSNANKDNESSKETITKSEETTTTNQNKTTEEVVTTNEEETTPEILREPVTLYWDKEGSLTVYEFIVDYKEDIKKIFDGREYHTGDIIDCRAEIETLGYDLNEYGKVFAYVYHRVSCTRGMQFEVIEREEDYIFDPAVNETQNLVFKNNMEGTLKFEVNYDEEGINFIIHFLK